MSCMMSGSYRRRKREKNQLVSPQKRESSPYQRDIRDMMCREAIGLAGNILCEAGKEEIKGPQRCTTKVCESCGIWIWYYWEYHTFNVRAVLWIWGQVTNSGIFFQHCIRIIKLLVQSRFMSSYWILKDKLEWIQVMVPNGRICAHTRD